MTAFPPLNVLFICTGNICRSPLALQLLQHALAAGDDGAALLASVSLASRGTHARLGAPMDQQSARQSEALGGDPAAHLAAPLTTADLRAADLVVTMTLEQRASAARMLPAVSKRSVTLVELARLIDHLAPERGGAGLWDESPKQKLDHLLAKRSAVPPPRHQEEFDIPDPRGRSTGTHVKVARQIQSAVEPLAGWLAASIPVPIHSTVSEQNAPPLTRRQARALRELDVPLV